MRILMIFFSLLQISPAGAESAISFTSAVRAVDRKYDYHWDYTYLTNNDRTVSARAACVGYLDISRRYLKITIVPGNEFDFRHKQAKDISVDKGSQAECYKEYLALKDISQEKPFVLNAPQ